MEILARFGKEQDDRRHPGHLVYPGTSAGFPVVGPVNGLLSDEEFENNVVHGCTYQTRMFYLWDQHDEQEYRWVMERVHNGWFRVIDREKIWVAEANHFQIYLEWVQVYGFPRTRGSNGSDYAQQGYATIPVALEDLRH